MNQDTITIIASILIPMLAGFGWLVHMINDLRKDHGDLIQSVRKDHGEKLSSISERISRIEGYLEGSKRTGTEK